MRVSIREKDLVTLGFLCGIAFAAAAPLVFSLRPLPKESAVFPDYAVAPNAPSSNGRAPTVRSGCPFVLRRTTSIWST